MGFRNLVRNDVAAWKGAPAAAPRAVHQLGDTSLASCYFYNHSQWFGSQFQLILKVQGRPPLAGGRRAAVCARPSH